VYERFFGLARKPFSLMPDAEFLYLGKGHGLALSTLEYGIAEQTGFVVITGEVGSGKTTLVRRLLATVADDVVVGLITNTHPAFGELMRWVTAAFDVGGAGKDKVDLHQAFVDFLISRYAGGRRTVLIVDEAQNLTPAMLEELRMLSNINADKDFLLQIVLCGQPELLATLKAPELRQFVQRIGISYHLQALDLEDTIAYIRHRLAVAGGEGSLFDDFACAAVHVFAGGTPRLINIVCDLALVYAFAEDRPRVDMETVIEAATARQAGGLGGLRPETEGVSRDEVRKAIRRSLVAAVDDEPARGRVRGE
jgi:type II secretory pathway predicted ATPase ExeA